MVRKRSNKQSRKKSKTISRKQSRKKSKTRSRKRSIRKRTSKRTSNKNIKGRRRSRKRNSKRRQTGGSTKDPPVRPTRSAPPLPSHTGKIAKRNAKRKALSAAAELAATGGHGPVDPHVKKQELKKCVDDCGVRNIKCKNAFEVMPAGYCDGRCAICKKGCKDRWGPK